MPPVAPGLVSSMIKKLAEEERKNEQNNTVVAKKIKNSIFNFSYGNAEVNMRNDNQVSKPLSAPSIAPTKRIVVPLKKGNAIKITIRYDDGEEQTWIDRAGISTSSPIPYLTRAKGNMETEIYFIYENGSVQIQQSRKMKETIKYYSESKDSNLNVTLTDGKTLKVEPGFKLDITYGKNNKNEWKQLSMRGKLMADFEKNSKPFNQMFLSKDFDDKMKENFEKFLLNYDCDRV